MGNLTFINYPSSPDVTFAYDPLNRLTNMVDAVGTTAYRYTLGGQLLSEDGPWTSDTVTNTYANRLRTGLGLQQPTGAWTNGFAHDNAGRLAGVVSPAGSFDYLLTGAGSEVRRLALPNGAYITNTFDPVARQLSTALKNSSHTTLNSHAYTYNLAGQRTQQAYAGGDTVDYSYDPIGQLQVADSSVAWQDRGYLYDAAWNLNYRTNSGVLVTAYQVDSRNQLTSAGSQACVYDDNGNLVQASTGSSLTAYVYDDENRLVRITNGPPASPPPQVAPMRPSPLPGWRTDLVYDGLGRLRIRHEYSNTVNGWWLDGTTLYIYDGNRVIQERNGTMVPTVSYTRGSDLSGSLEGAGGIGGLLARSTGNGSTWTSHAYYHADGNGNITALVDSTQSVVAAYRYDPFANALAKTGTLADANLYRFSSKELHAKSGMYYYLYRFYDPNLQRWINRDPIGEPGAWIARHYSAPRKSLRQQVHLQEGNQYTFADNRPTLSLDVWGLEEFELPLRDFDPDDPYMCDKLEARMESLRNTAKDPDNPLRAISEAILDQLQQIWDDYCPDDPNDQPDDPVWDPVPVAPKAEPVTCNRNVFGPWRPGDPVTLDPWIVIGGIYSPATKALVFSPGIAAPVIESVPEISIVIKIPRIALP